MNIYGLTLEMLEEYFVNELGSKKFHADQLFSWLYERRIHDYSEITNIIESLEGLKKACNNITFLGAGGNSFPWQGRQEIVYSSTDETRDVLKNHIEAAGKYEPTIDNNWKFKAIDTEAKVFFTSHENGVNYLDENPAISTEKEVAGTKLYKYNYDLAYGLTTDEEVPEQPEKPEVPGEETPEQPEMPEVPGEETPEQPEKPEVPGEEETPELPEISGDTEEDKLEKPENSKPENKPSSPQTGDASMIGYAAMGIGAVAGLFAIRRRK